MRVRGPSVVKSQLLPARSPQPRWKAADGNGSAAPARMRLADHLTLPPSSPPGRRCRARLHHLFSGPFPTLIRHPLSHTLSHPTTLCRLSYLHRLERLKKNVARNLHRLPIPQTGHVPAKTQIPLSLQCPPTPLSPNQYAVHKNHTRIRTRKRPGRSGAAGHRIRGRGPKIKQQLF